MDDPTDPWDSRVEGVVVLPSGRRVRGRGLRKPLVVGPPPAFGLYLSGREPDPRPWPSRWLPWPDFRLPADESETREALIDLWRRAAEQRVEIACGGGRGRTGTALACLAVLDGVPACEAVSYVRQNYDTRAVETCWQRRYVSRFASR